MKRMMLVVVAAALVAALFTLPSADAQSPADLLQMIVALQAKITALESKVNGLNQQIAELRGPIRVSATGVEIRTGDFTVLASGRISLRASGPLELRGSTVTQN